LEDVFLDQNEQETLWSIFDSYCKTVIRNTSRDIGRRYKRQLRNEVLVDFSSGGFLDETTVDHDFSIERQFITYKGESYPVKSCRLYEILTQLPAKQLEVIILKYWCKHTDKKAADLIGVTVRTVRNRRSRAQKKIQTRWKGV